MPSSSQALQGAGSVSSPLGRGPESSEGQQGPRAGTLPLQERGQLEVIKDDMLGVRDSTQSWGIEPREAAQEGLGWLGSSLSKRHEPWYPRKCSSCSRAPKFLGSSMLQQTLKHRAIFSHSSAHHAPCSLESLSHSVTSNVSSSNPVIYLLDSNV